MPSIKNFQLEKFDGTIFDLYQENRDKSVLLIFFRGAWCNLCKKQLLDFQAHLQDFNELNIKIVAIAPDSKFKLSLMKTFLKIKFEILADEKFKIINSLHLRTRHKGQDTAKPAFFLINFSHQILLSYIGEEYDDRLSAKQIIQQIESLKSSK